MTLEGNGRPITYQVHLSANNRTFLKQLHQKYAQKGQGKAFLTLLRLLYGRLRLDPLIFGEPLYHLPALNLAIRHGSIAPIVVVYGVHQEKRMVFIREFKLLSSSK